MEYLAISIPPDPSQVAGLPRGMIADTIERLIAELDARDGDPDEETVDAFGKHPDDEDDDPGEGVGDELDGTNAEDEKLCLAAIHSSFHLRGPGCVYSDDDTEHDGREVDDGC